MQWPRHWRGRQSGSVPAPARIGKGIKSHSRQWTMLLGLWSVLATGQPIGVEAVVAQSRPIFEDVPISGTLTSPQVSLLSAQVEGLVSEVRTDAGDTVVAGQSLLILDTELSEIALQAAKARVESARQTWLDSQRRFQEAQSLINQQSIAQSEVDALAARMRIDAAMLEVAQVNARDQQARLHRHTIKAPFDGVVSRRLIDVGEWVAPGTAMLELVGQSQLWADYQVPQRFYPQVGPQTRLRLRFDALPGQILDKPMHAKVPQSRSNGRTFLLRVAIDPKQYPELIPGMSASANLRLDLHRQSLVIPRDALIRYPDGRISVWVSQQQTKWGQTSKVTEQLVETGINFGESVEVTRGLNAGQQVIVRGNEALQEGQQVRLEQAKFLKPKESRP
ncbi:efflux RND transporter periplasmic adaptor subunit [Bowmanella dokdonensis]|uniref:Efflux RND transporter periplasmic adaptor subunit n=1 Tax=Bowmanella dokdonensis TaxID=751969 RepID=A0A939DPC4_9ALTE|nr:efflux RND transporter periplasmic adaptor subunit [Bowmanella dokdonensis]MBN7825476.1 efflux RND transporter periplasmic adaptor subunit [Bowmanella dokdonensis]